MAYVPANKNDRPFESAARSVERAAKKEPDCDNRNIWFEKDKK